MWRTLVTWQECVCARQTRLIGCVSPAQSPQVTATLLECHEGRVMNPGKLLTRPGGETLTPGTHSCTQRHTTCMKKTFSVRTEKITYQQKKIKNHYLFWFSNNTDTYNNVNVQTNKPQSAERWTTTYKKAYVSSCKYYSDTWQKKEKK